MAKGTKAAKSVTGKSKVGTKVAKPTKASAKSVQKSVSEKPLTVEEIESIRSDILESPKNYNKIVKLLDALNSLVGSLEKSGDNDIDVKVSRALIFNLYKVFQFLISKSLIKVMKSQNEQKQTVAKWLNSKYIEFQATIFKLWNVENFTQTIGTLKIDGLERILQLVRDESKYLVPNAGDQFFSSGTYRKVLAGLLKSGSTSSIDEQTGLSNDYVLHEFLDSYFEQYWDLKFYFYSEFPAIVEDLAQESAEIHRIVFAKLVTLTKKSPMYDLENKDAITESALFVKNAPENTMYSVNLFKINFEKSWIAALNLPDLQKYEYVSTLTILHKRIIPFFSNAQKLMDFLAASYTLGIKTKDIVMAILALNGLWELMKSYNLDYPDFYTNLYAILTPELLHLPEKSRFFRLLDLFMSSTHLPAAIVASFIKRLARLSLTAPPSGIVVVIPFIYNLIKKHGHSTCMLLIHSTTTAEQDAEYFDPYDEDEKDPAKTEAIGSSIWELESMVNHYHPNISALVKIFSQHFTKYSYNMEDFLDWSYTKLLDAEMKKNLKGELGLEFEKWSSMFDDDGYMEDYLY
jgi:U3 small nucleolar RNA-associated protein 19